MNNKTQKRTAVADSDDVSLEKWLVAYRNPASKKHSAVGGSVFMRQFYAPGFYEAYDTVFTHAEKMNLEVLWFQEKRNCEHFLNYNFPWLESLCTYCNKKFNHAEPVPCSYDDCSAEFCSRECMADHFKLRHHRSKSTVTTTTTATATTTTTTTTTRAWQDSG